METTTLELAKAPLYLIWTTPIYFGFFIGRPIKMGEIATQPPIG